MKVTDKRSIDFTDEWNFSLDHVYQEVTERNEIISATWRLHVEQMLGCKDDVTLEHEFLLVFNQFTFVVLVLSDETKVDEPYLVQAGI